MATIESILAMGLPRGANPMRMGEIASTAGGGLTWEDANAAFGLLPDVEQGVLAVKCAQHLMTAKNLAAFTAHLSTNLVRFDERYKTYGANVAEGAAWPRQAAIVRTALAEWIDPRNCRTCYRSRLRGHIQQHVDGKGVLDMVCPRCQGQGWMPWSDNKRAKSVGVRRETWGKYAPGYESVLKTCTASYREAAETFKQVLFGESAAA